MKWGIKILFFILSMHVSAGDFQSKSGAIISFIPYSNEPGGRIVVSAAGGYGKPLSIDVMSAELTYVEMSKNLLAVISASEVGKHYKVIYFLTKDNMVSEIADVEYDHEYSPDVGDVGSSIQIVNNSEDAWLYVKDVEFKNSMSYVFLPILSGEFSKPSKYYMNAVESDEVKHSLYLKDAYLKRWGGSLCADNEVTILSCRANMKMLSLCADEGNSIVYKYGKKGNVELSLSASDQPFFSQSYTFNNGKYTYRVRVKNDEGDSFLSVQSKGKEIYQSDCYVNK